jgi:probable HAF family extracellular repeat protein
MAVSRPQLQRWCFMRTVILAVVFVLLSVVGGALGAVQYAVTDIGSVTSAQSEARAVNEAGIVVGLCYVPPEGDYRGFKYENVTLTDLGTPGGSWSGAYDINLHLS